MKILSSRIFWGILLVIGGAFLLLDTFNVFKGGALFWTVIAGIVGFLFLSLYINNHVHWWALIPGVIFLSLAALIGLDSFLPGFSDTNLGGTVILGGIALSFLLVYLAQRGNWWAIIPAGVMATIAIVALVDTGNSSAASGGIFFLGLAITFVLVAVLPTSIGQMRWAWIPAIILGVMGILILVAAVNLINYIWPILLLVAGVWLIIRSVVRR